MEHILSLSYGKDSLACLAAIEQLGWPLDRIIHAEVWATDDIPADLPPMVEFKAKADAIIKERWGINVEHLCATKNGQKLTYEKLFYHVPKRKPGGRFLEDTVAGYPYQKGAWCQDRLKGNVLDAISTHTHTRRRSLDSLLSSAAGARNSKTGHTNYLGVPDHTRTVVQQPSQEAGFLSAPWHEERRKISCNI